MDESSTHVGWRFEDRFAQQSRDEAENPCFQIRKDHRAQKTELVDASRFGYIFGKD